MTSTAAVNGIEICYETLGDPSNECLLLVAGFGQQLTDWDDALCELFVSAGFYVVRFDNRDAGFSTRFSDFQSPDLNAALAGDSSSAGYALEDMAADALALMASLSIEKAHILGVSMGGMIAQLVAIAAPERVLSLVLLSTNTGARNVGQPAPEIAAAPLVRSQSGDRVADAIASSSRWASWELGTTEESLRGRIERRMERAYDPLSSPRQLVAIAAAPDRTEHLRSLAVPTIVIHGREDPMVNVSGGEALAATIPGAELLLIDNLRHDIPMPIWPQLLDAIQRNAQALR